jgi:RepB DNA-primase from phage plasmid
MDRQVNCDTSTRTAPAYSEHSEPSHDAIALWQHVFGTRPDRIALMSALRTGEKNKLGPPSHHFFASDQLEDAARCAALQDQRGREVYFCAHQLLADERIKDNAAPVLALWAEVDEGNLDDVVDAAPVPPTAIVESSPRHYHLYWRLKYPIRPDTAENRNKRLGQVIGADPSGYDVTQLLRVPGTTNHKYRPTPVVRLLKLDEETAYDPDLFDRALPKLPDPPRPAGLPSEPLSDDDEELVASLRRQSPLFDRTWNDDIRDYAGESEADWGMAQELLRACAGDPERIERIMRSSPRAERRGERWDRPEPGGTWLSYTIARAAERPSAPRDTTEYRSDDPTTWPTLPAPVLDGPQNGHCSEHCRRHEQEVRALRRQINLINRLVCTDYTEAVRLSLLRWTTVIGFELAHRKPEIKVAAKSVASSIHISDQTTRAVLHGLARYDNGKLVREDGLFDLKTDRRPVGDNVTEPEHWESAFKVTPVFEQPAQETTYNTILEQILGYDLELPRKEKKPRKKLAAVKPPPEVVQIACPEHRAEGREVVCAGCGEVLIEMRRYLPPLPQNTSGYRSKPSPPPWVPMAIPTSVLVEPPPRPSGEMLPGGLPWR